MTLNVDPTVLLLKLDTYLIDNYSAIKYVSESDQPPHQHDAKGFVGLRLVFVELFEKNEVFNLNKYTVGRSDGRLFKLVKCKLHSITPMPLLHNSGNLYHR